MPNLAIISSSNLASSYPTRQTLIRTLNPVLQAYFRPELLNRLDEVLVFRSLDRPAVRAVAGLLVAATAARLLEGERNIRLTVAPSLLDHICAAGYDQVRPPPP